MSNWRRWVGVEEKGSVNIPKLTHDRLREVSAQTGMSMQFWANVGLRFFFAHARGQLLVNSAKGVTMDEYYARTGAMDRMVEQLLLETGEADVLARQSREDAKQVVAPAKVIPEGFKDPDAPQMIARGGRMVPAPMKPEKAPKSATAH